MNLKDTLSADNRLGFGAAPLGNMFRDIPDAEAVATVEVQRHRRSISPPISGARCAGSSSSRPMRRCRSIVERRAAR
ncbi:hypothetical protein WK91_36075 [Burkholderia cepacia]|nr:hypothetical protein WK91_36075 [Burkholderia cepacia]